MRSTLRISSGPSWSAICWKLASGAMPLSEHSTLMSSYLWKSMPATVALPNTASSRGLASGPGPRLTQLQ